MLNLDKHKTINYKQNLYFYHVTFGTELVKLREVTKCYLVTATDANSNFTSANAVSLKSPKAGRFIVPTELHI